MTMPRSRHPFSAFTTSAMAWWLMVKTLDRRAPTELLTGAVQLVRDVWIAVGAGQGLCQRVGKAVLLFLLEPRGLPEGVVLVLVRCESSLGCCWR